MSAEYSKRVGETLRSVRRAKDLSLQEVEGLSNQEFKASVLGAYERGERAVSVPRLWRLSNFYGVAVTELLPADEPATAAGGGDSNETDARHCDLVESLGLSRAEAQILSRVVARVGAALEAEPEPSPDESGPGSR
ncbi:MAG: helix-turn-helix transcriptional regulator [Acidimicrobiaceae bacterium]|nr:helix-turn-helix domain-containing protein [Acidimicrobiia bacterium]MCY4492776.1 helix-turn-helix transcriptional regulator [Acidimicrobiaceae bacterium]